MLILLSGVRSPAGQLLQSAGPVFDVIGADNYAVVQLVNVDGQDVEAAPFAIYTEERACRRSRRTAAHGHEIAVLMHRLHGPVEIRDELAEEPHLADEPVAALVLARIVTHAFPGLGRRADERRHVGF